MSRRLALPLFLTLAVSSPPVIAAAADFVCGEALVDARDGQSYPTVPIGDQCWLGRNLDFGRKVRDADPQDDGVVEKTCYGNEAESCSVYGGLYTWTEAMQGSSEAETRGASRPGRRPGSRARPRPGAPARPAGTCRHARSGRRWPVTSAP
jgi:hypothetical protein